jgi:6-phosphogluconolactonase
VGPDHPENNFRAGYQALLAPRGVPEVNIHRVQGELNPAEAAGGYEQDLLDWFGDPRPRFDLILLGMGNDGHTASLFPGTSLVASPKRDATTLVEAVQVPKLASWRITFTPYLINAAARVVFLVKGEEKAPALKAVLEGPDQPATYPAQLVQPRDGKLIWLIDQGAASLLES